MVANLLQLLKCTSKICESVWVIQHWHITSLCSIFSFPIEGSRTGDSGYLPQEYNHRGTGKN